MADPMAGVLRFKSLDAAWRAGFTVHDRLEDAYVVRQRQESGGFIMALAAYGDRPELREHPESIHLHRDASRGERA